MSQERERERHYRKLLAFSLLEIIIVVAIIAILSAVMVVKWRDMREMEKARQCRAQILEMVSALEAIKVSNDFTPSFGHGTGEDNWSTKPITKSDADKINFPYFVCPMGTMNDYKKHKAWDGFDWSASNWNRWRDTCYSIAMGPRYNNYTIRCMVHVHHVSKNADEAKRFSYSGSEHGFERDL